jgi:molecular chaperone HscB
MEMMDINERLMEVGDKEELGHITAEVLAIESDINEELHSLTKDYGQLNDKTKESR